MGEKFKRLVWLWAQCFKSMRNVSTFVPFLLYGLVQVILLYSLINFNQSPFSSYLIPIIRKFFGEAALHYPNFFYILAPFYSQVNLILSGLIGVIIIGMGTHLFAVTFNGSKSTLGQAIKSTMPRYGLLFIVWILESALTIAMIIGVPWILNKLLQPEYRISRFIELGGLLLGIAMASIFAYTTALIVLDKQKLLRTLSQTFSIFKKNSITTFLLIAIPTFLYFPINFLTRKSVVLITKFSPEIIVLLLSTGVFISFISSYFQIGTITRFYLLLKEKRSY